MPYITQNNQGPFFQDAHISQPTFMPTQIDFDPIN